MFMKPNRGFCNPKKDNDHNMFNTNWIPNTNNKYSLPTKPSLITKYKEIPIKAYKVIQTGPKSHEGGLDDGFINVTYHVETDLEVNIEPIMPAN